MTHYDTLSQATTGLKERGYNRDFMLEDHHIACRETGKTYDPRNFKVNEYHRFEGPSNPGDMSVVYAIHAGDGEKGVLVDAFGTYGGNISREMLDKLKLDPKKAG